MVAHDGDRQQVLGGEEGEGDELLELASEHVDRHLWTRHVGDQQVVEPAAEAEPRCPGENCWGQGVLDGGEDRCALSLAARLDVLHGAVHLGEALHRIGDVDGQWRHQDRDLVAGRARGVGVAQGHGYAGPEGESVDLLAPGLQEASERSCDGCQHDVVDGGAQGVLHRAVVRQRGADDLDPPVRSRRRVQHRGRCGVHDGADHCSKRAHQARRLTRRRCGADRQPHPLHAESGQVAHGACRAVGQQPDRPRCRGRLPRGDVGGLGIGGQVEQRGHQVDPADAVDHRVVGLGDEREPAVGQPLDEPHLPQRLGAVESLRDDARHEGEQLFVTSRRRQRRVSHVVADPEAGVLCPHRPSRPQRHRQQLLAVAGHEVESRGDVRTELLPGRRRPREDTEATDVHVRPPVLLVQEPGVDAGQPVEVSLCHRSPPESKWSCGRMTARRPARCKTGRGADVR